MAGPSNNFISAISINNTPYRLKDERLEDVVRVPKAVTIGSGDIANQVFFQEDDASEGKLYF